MRIVIATDDKKNLNGHFAVAQFFMFYDITEESCELIREVLFTQAEGNVVQLRPANKKPFCIDERIDSIKGSDVIFVSAIGGPIADRVIAANVYPIEMNAPESIDETLSKLQTLLRGKKPLWLKRILKHDFMFEGS